MIDSITTAMLKAEENIYMNKESFEYAIYLVKEALACDTTKKSHKI